LNDASEVVDLCTEVAAGASKPRSPFYTVFYAAVFANGYYLIIKGNRETLREMREQRISGVRPQVLIQARYSRLPMVDLIVRNFGGGVART
jgi:hypothetical protein